VLGAGGDRPQQVAGKELREGRGRAGDDARDAHADRPPADQVVPLDDARDGAGAQLQETAREAGQRDHETERDHGKVQIGQGQRVDEWHQRRVGVDDGVAAADDDQDREGAARSRPD